MQKKNTVTLFFVKPNTRFKMSTKHCATGRNSELEHLKRSLEFQSEYSQFNTVCTVRYGTILWSMISIYTKIQNSTTQYNEYIVQDCTVQLKQFCLLLHRNALHSIVMYSIVMYCHVPYRALLQWIMHYPAILCGTVHFLTVLV